MLVDAGLLTPEQLEPPWTRSATPTGPRQRLGQVVVDLGFATEREVAEALADLLGLVMLDLSRITPVPRRRPDAAASRWPSAPACLVLERNERGGLIVATSDPTNVLALDDVKLYTRSHARSTSSSPPTARSTTTSPGPGRWARTDAGRRPSRTRSRRTTSRTSLGADRRRRRRPIVKLVNQILADAVRLRASDIHIEVQRDALRIRYRVDGVLRDVMNAPEADRDRP